MKKPVLSNEENSAKQVVEHGIWQRSRGRNPSMSFQNERNPKKAFELAKYSIRGAKVRGAVMVRLPVGDIRFYTISPPYWKTQDLKDMLYELGFEFWGDTDQDSLHDVALPTGWTIGGDVSSTGWSIKDEKQRTRIEVVKKIPWGESDWIYFMTLRPSSHGVTDPRIGW